ncbi:MAG: hypothetical protein MK085_04885 [Phycisphaerales bacterium]|nr:hypothetical protein [Phycisphaerales bacterium]
MWFHLLPPLQSTPAFVARRRIRGAVVAFLSLFLLSMPALGAQDAEEEDPEKIARSIAEMDDWARSRMGDILTSSAGAILEDQDIMVSRLDLAAMILEVAVETDPDSLPGWTKLQDLSTALIDDVEGSDEIQLLALDNMIRLDPGDMASRLHRLVLEVEQRPTAEGRIAAYQSILSPENIKRLGPQISARLAFDLALLQRRVGNLEDFASNLALSVELDPSYPIAVDTSAGFFRMVSDDTLVEFELLVAAITANPINVFLYRTLGEGLLAQGAYEGAGEILDLARRLDETPGPKLLALEEDLAVALWGAGERDAALESIDRAIKIQASLTLKNMQRLDTTLDTLKLLQESPPMKPELALVKAAILSSGADGAAFEAFLPDLEQSFQSVRTNLSSDLERARNIEAEPRVLDQLKMRLGELAGDEAWARVWFLDDLGDVPNLIDKALTAGAITEVQKTVLEGWLAMREGRIADGRRILEPLAEQSSFAQVGLALIDDQEGRRKSAAQRLLKVYRGMPGQKLGIWCRDRLSRMLGAQVPPPEGSAVLDNLIATMPEGIGRAVRDLRGVLDMSVIPQKNPMGPFDPLQVTVTIRNGLSIPLNIGPGGPINPTMAIIADLTVAATDVPVLLPIIISLEKDFSIPAQGQIEVDVDLSASQLGELLDGMALQGASIRLRAVVNYRIAQENVTLGKLGEQATSVPIRLNGAYKVEEATSDLLDLLGQIRRPRTIDDLKALILVGQYYNLSLSWIEDLRPTMREAMIQGFTRLPPYAKAWALARLPQLEGDLVRMVDSALATNNTAVYAVLLAQWSMDPGSPAIVAGRRSKNPTILKMAEAAFTWTTYLESLTRKAFELGEDEDELLDFP